MFRRGGGVSRSLHAPHGVKITALDNNPRMRRKLSWASPKVRNAASEGVLTHRPMVLKEGFLYKPGFLKIGGRKRRWCVLRTYSPTEASIDIYMDDTKSRFKGTISLDKDLCPMLIVKNYDTKKKSPKHVYLSLKIGKRTYLFTTDSFRELKEWSALLRQAIDNGYLFSGKITEPLNIEDGMVNVKFNSNCIAVICPIRENAIKTWRLNHITSFGQSGGILTFECCSTCSDPGTSRCSINIIQEKSSIVLNLMEKAIRSNPNTGEIHYERSILGDIYHCDHDCGQPQRLLPAYSDPNIYRSVSTSPKKEVAVPIDIHEFEVPFSTLSSGKSNDSGLPDTHHDVTSILSGTPSPTDANVKASHGNKQHNTRISIPTASTTPVHTRSYSETAAQMGDYDTILERRMTIDTEPAFSKPKYTDVLTAHSPKRTRFEDPAAVQYATVQHGSPSRESRSKLEPVDENDGIYDTPFEPGFWETAESGPFSPPGPSMSQRSSRSDSSTGQPITVRLTPAHTTPNSPGSDVRGGKFEEPAVPSRHRRGNRQQVKEIVKLFGGSPQKGRSRMHSTGDVLDCVPPEFRRNHRGSVDNLHQVGTGNGFVARSDLLSKLHEQEELLTKFLARSRNERNDEYGSTNKDDTLNKPYRIFEEADREVDLENYRYTSPTHPRSGCSSSASDRGATDRVLTKVASDTVRGYAYKIQIPLSDTIYDVPRRAAPAPNLANLRVDAPPKPQRYIAST